MRLASAVGILIPLAVIVAVVIGVVMLARRLRAGAMHESSRGVVRRLYYYTLAFVSLMVAANGVVLLLRYLIDSLAETRVVSPSTSQLALGLALTLVATPLWIVFWTMIQRSVGQDRAEADSLVRKVYLYLTLAVSLGITFVWSVSLVRWALRDIGFEGGHIASPVIWGSLWLYHWRVEASEGQATDEARFLRRLYLHLASGAGLAVLAYGVGLLVAGMGREAYDAALPGQVMVQGKALPWNDEVRRGLAMCVVAALVWWWHWLRPRAVGVSTSITRQVYLYIFAILSGATTVMVSLSVLVFGILEWLLGAPGPSDVATRLRFTPEIIGAVVAGVGAWGYHWAVAREEARSVPDRLASARRVYRYLVGALGLGALAAGLVYLFAVLLGMLVPAAREQLVGIRWWSSPLATAITLLLVGAPIWSICWLGAQREAGQSIAERAALARRVFLYGLFGVGVLVALGSASALLFFLLRDALDGNLSMDIMRDLKWSLGMLLMAGVVAIYYWAVLQEDRRALASVAPKTGQPQRKKVIVVGPGGTEEFVHRLEAQLGHGVDFWRQTGPDAKLPELPDAELARLVERVRDAPSTQVLLIMDVAGVRLISYREQ